MKPWLRTTLIVALIVLALLAGGFGGVLLDRQGLLPGVFAQDAQAKNGPNLGLINEAWATIQRNYVDQAAVDSKNLTYGAIGGMVDALGDTGHSRFLTPQMVKEEQNFTQGTFEGIGALMEMKDGHATVVTPFDGSPAQKAGLRPGDIILEVNGENVVGLPLGEVVNRVLGPAGTKVTLTVQDPDTQETRTLTITRAHIELKNVTWQMLPGTQIADIRLSAFSQDVTKDLQAAIQDARSQGATALILDLRNDPGGLLGEAIGVTSQFLNNGNVLLEKNAQGETTPQPVQPGGIATDIPLVVLINNGTASAAEIVSGALQDAKRAQLVGETTFGTGTVLLNFPLSDGSALLLATQEWLTPSGRVIWHQGIEPDVKISLPADASTLIPEEIKQMTAEELQKSQDTQLLKAIELLTQPSP